jgi:hypothetical protein
LAQYYGRRTRPNRLVLEEEALAKPDTPLPRFDKPEDRPP